MKIFYFNWVNFILVFLEGKKILNELIGFLNIFLFISLINIEFYDVSGYRRCNEREFLFLGFVF